jgi:hypothetical protein
MRWPTRRPRAIHLRPVNRAVLLGYRVPVMSRLPGQATLLGPWLLCLLLLDSCPGGNIIIPPGDIGTTKRVQVSGRVVDLETCLSMAGCMGAKGLRVSLFSDNRIISEPTQPDGAFVLENVPDRSKHYLMVTDASGTNKFLTCLQAEPINTAGNNVWGVELYALLQAGGLYEGIKREASLEVGSQSLYLGQAFYLKGGTEMKALEGVTVPTESPASVRYVECNPSLQKPPLPSCTRVLFDEKRSFTANYGEFLVYSPSRSGTLSLALTSPDYSFAPVSVPWGAGYLSIGVHQGHATHPLDGGIQSDQKSTLDQKMDKPIK